MENISLYKIIDTATQLISRENELSISKVAKNPGVSKQALYNYIDGIEDLKKYVIQQILSEFYVKLKLELFTGVEAKDKLNVFLTEYYHYGTLHYELFKFSTDNIEITYKLPQREALFDLFKSILSIYDVNQPHIIAINILSWLHGQILFSHVYHNTDEQLEQIFNHGKQLITQYMEGGDN